ncbi:MAG: hypothetical protein JNJ86_16660 [Chitinophagaceae bacterium]|nr:hypothetical protein [Chitinophagaceae bacterium]
MRLFSTFIIRTCWLFFLTQCTNEQGPNNSKQILSHSVKTEPEYSLTGQWLYKNTIWYSSELTLNENGLFTFHDQGCYGQKFSQGRWSKNNGLIQLTSFDIFKQQEETKPATIAEVHQKKPNRELEEGDVEYSFVGFDKAASQILPGPNDTVRVYLDKIQLQVRNDTLYCVGSNNLPEEARFHRKKNNR